MNLATIRFEILSEHFEHDDGKGKYITFFIVELIVHDFRCHVVAGTHVTRCFSVGNSPCETKISQLCNSVSVDQYIITCQVSTQ